MKRALEDETAPVTLLGLSVSNLTTANYIQLTLAFEDGDLLTPGSPLGARMASLDHEVDEIRDRFGNAALTYGLRSRGTSDEFRRLAERS